MLGLVGVVGSISVRRTDGALTSPSDNEAWNRLSPCDDDARPSCLSRGSGTIRGRRCAIDTHLCRSSRVEAALDLADGP
jgi:hypothetical protein